MKTNMTTLQGINYIFGYRIQKFHQGTSRIVKYDFPPSGDNEQVDEYGCWVGSDHK